MRTLQDGTQLVAEIVEVEAYLGDGTDAASHAHRGPTARNHHMFGPPGRLYAYLSYGIHTCVNVVCERDGVAAAVLLRAAEPLDGEDAMRRHRGLAANTDRRLLTSGPGRLAQALALTLEHDGIRLGGPSLALHRPRTGSAPPNVVAGPRIGISRAVDLPYRFHIAGNRFVSGPRTRVAQISARPRSD